MPIRRVIVAQGEGKRYEYNAASAITPGDLVQLLSDGTIQRQGTALLKVNTLFAINAEFFGKGVNDYTYAALDRVPCEHVFQGCLVNVTLAANAAAIVIGDMLEAAADGTLRKMTTGVPLAQAVEAVNNSANGSKTWCLARII